MMVQGKLLFALLCFLTISGCAFFQKSANQPDPQKGREEEQALPTEISDATAFITRSLTPTLNETPKLVQSTDQVEDHAIRTCPNGGIPQRAGEGFGLIGSIVFQEKAANTNQMMVASGNPITYVPLPVPAGQSYEMLGFPPDGRWFAYASRRGGEDQGVYRPTVFLISDQGKIIERRLDVSIFQDRLLPESEWIGVRSTSLQWRNNQYIHLSVQYQVSRGSMGIYPVDALYNPVENRWNEEMYQDIPKNRASERIGFSPDLTRGIFATQSGAILVNLPGGDFIWQMNHKSDPIPAAGPEYAWKEDSSQVAFAPHEETIEAIYLVDRDGGNKQTVLAPEGLGRLGAYTIQDTEWAPDGRYLAISATVRRPDQETSDSHLFVYDTILEEYIYSCPIGYYSPWLSWSPDGRYIVPYLPGGATPLVLYEIHGPGEVIQLLDGIEYGGWSREFKVLQQK